MVLSVGDSPAKEEELVDRFDLHFDASFLNFLSSENISLAFSTYEGGKLMIVGPGNTEPVITERDFPRCMALHVDNDQNIWLTSDIYIFQLENGLNDGQIYENGWDRLYMPRNAHLTGGVDIHEITVANDGFMYGVITGHNCVARINHNDKGCFSPYWKPPFINNIITADRCHLNGICLEDGALAYATMVAKTREANEWKQHRNSGGIIMDMRNNEIVASDLCMPHTPRIYEGDLWFLEAGKGYLCRCDQKTGEVERVLWRPGFLRGLHFYKNFAFICSSAPRDETFDGLPLDEELGKRNADPRCAVDIIDMTSGELACSAHITGFVREIYDVAILQGCRQPLLHGLTSEEIRKLVIFGEDFTELGALGQRRK